MDKKDVIAFFDRCAPTWDAEMIKSDAIIADANSQAAHLKQKAENEIQLEKKQMLSDVKAEISDLAVSIASRIMEREVNAQDHAEFVDQFIQNVGEQQ